MAKAEIPSLDDALDAALRAKFAKTDVIVGRASDVGFLSDVQEWVPTGIYWLDLLLSRGQGLPVGRFIEVFGPEEGGKSALSEFLAGLYVRTQASKPHWADLEKSLDWKHFACYGVTRDTLWTPDLETLEQTWDYIGATLDTLDERIAPLAKAKLPPDPPALFVVDSIAAGCPQAELEEETAENKHMAETARAMSKGFRKYLRRVSKSRSTVVFTNQIRDKMNAKPGQKQTQPPGGRAMRFGCSIRLELVRVQNIEGKSGRQVGHMVKVTAVKNRHAPSRMTCEFIISYTRGIDVAWSKLPVLQELRVHPGRRRQLALEGPRGHLQAHRLRRLLPRQPGRRGEGPRRHLREGAGRLRHGAGDRPRGRGGGRRAPVRSCGRGGLARGAPTRHTQRRR